MGGAAGKQPDKIKKIYVKSKETTGDEEDEVFSSSGAGYADRPTPILVSSIVESASDAEQHPSSSSSGASALIGGADFAAQMAKIKEDNAREAEAASISPGVVRVQTVAALEDAIPLKPAASKKIDLDAAEAAVLKGTFKRDLNRLSPRSISSDEGSDENPVLRDSKELLLNPVADFVPPEEHIPKVTKEKFSEVLRDGYERQAKMRQEWLKSLGEATVDPVFLRASTRAAGSKFIVGTGFSAAREAPALVDPDIMTQVRKMNVKLHVEGMPQVPC